MNGAAYSEGYTYNSADGSLNTMTTGVGTTLTMGYDGLRRLTSVTGGPVTRQYTYRDIDSTKTTLQVASVTSGGQQYGYTYDSMGNIATFSAPGKGTVTYTYDNQGQLLSAAGDTTYTYTYDGAGNILTASDGTATHSYTYGDTDWKDLLTGFDGQAIIYDAIGNPTSYCNGTRWAMTWENGRSLATASDGTSSLSFAYDANGLRTSKTVNGVSYRYYYASGRLMRMSWGTNIIDFFYDESGQPYAMKYNGTAYYYITNLQGDVMRIVDGSQNTVTSYDYDPYGKVISATGTLANINPLRYRGYVYDQETGFYYLQSRYYDPTVARFINADGYASAGQELLGKNMFAYCKNNPITMVDDSGSFALTAAFVTNATVVAVSAIIAGVSNAISTAVTGGSMKDCLIAGVAGAIGGAIGASISLLKISNPLLGVVARGVATAVTDVSTSWWTNGGLTPEDGAWIAVDVVMDMTLSPIAYYYNPVSDVVKQTAINATLDGMMDITQSKLYLGDSSNQGSATSTQNRGTKVKKDKRYYVQRKVGIILGIIT